jgi:hypothetical protein
LAATANELCDHPEERAAIDAFVSARKRFQEIEGSLGL